MAEEKFQFTLELATRATGDGARRTADDLERIKRAATDTTDKARVSEFAFYDLDAQLKKTNQTVDSFTSGQTKLAPATRNNAQALYVFSQAAEDAQYGIRGVLNNIPQLIFALGGGAGIAGAISLGAVAASQLVSWLSRGKQEAGELKDALEGVAEAAGRNERARIDARDALIEGETAAAEAAKQKWEQTSEAESKYSLTALSNAEKLRLVQVQIAEALGIQIDRFAELEAIAEQEARKREAAAQAQIEAENRRVQAADQALETAREEAARRDDQANGERQRLAALTTELALLEKRREVLQAFASGDGGRFANVNLDAIGLGDIQRQFAGASANAPFLGPGGLAEVRRSAGRQADDIARTIESQENRIEEVRSALDRLTGANGLLARAYNALERADVNLQDIQQAAAANIAGIQETLAADNLVASSGQLLESSKLLADSVQSAVEGVRTNNERGLAAKQIIETALADGRITADESTRVAANLGTLIGLVQSNQATIDGNVLRLIALQEQSASAGRESESRITRLEQQVRQLSIRR